MRELSPQGQAWLTRGQGSGLGVRVFDAGAGGVDVVADETLDVGELRHLQAWDGKVISTPTPD